MAGLRKTDGGTQMVNQSFPNSGSTTALTERNESKRRRAPLVTREQVVDVAYGLVVSDGPDGLSMRKLASALHVSLPTVYTAIRSREHLVSQLQHRLFEHIAAKLAADDLAVDPSTGTDPGSGRLDSLTGAFLDWARANPQLADFLLSEQFSAEVARRVTHPDRDSADGVSYLVGLFREQARAGALPPVDPIIAVTFAVAQIRAVLSLMREPALRELPADRWHALAASTLRQGLQTLGS